MDREDATEVGSELDKLMPAKREGPWNMLDLACLKDEIHDRLPSGTIVDLTTFMNSITATVWVLGIKGPLIRTTVVEKGITS